MWIASAFVPAPWRYALWAAAMTIDVSRVLAPNLRRSVGRLPPDREHMEEHYALFTIIVLGESFIKTIGAIADEGISVDTQVPPTWTAIPMLSASERRRGLDGR